jgi:hypothetical protein
MWDPCKLDDNDVTNYLKILQNNDNLLNVKGKAFTSIIFNKLNSSYKHNRR